MTIETILNDQARRHMKYASLAGRLHLAALSAGLSGDAESADLMGKAANCLELEVHMHNPTRPPSIR